MLDHIGIAQAGNAPKSLKKSASQKIFEAARELFYQRGVRAVGVDEIVSAAGVTKPSLYRAFRSKDELVVACLQESADEGREQLMRDMLAAGNNPLDKLRAVVRHFADRMDDPSFRGCQISNFAVEFPEADHPGRAVLIGCKTNLRAIILGLAQDMRLDTAEELADGLMLVLEGAIFAHHIFGCGNPTRAMVATCEALIECHLLKADALAGY